MPIPLNVARVDPPDCQKPKILKEQRMSPERQKCGPKDVPEIDEEWEGAGQRPRKMRQ